MVYSEAENLLVFHEFKKKELVFLHMNIVTFRYPGVLCKSFNGKSIKMDSTKSHLFALMIKSQLLILMNIDKDGSKSEVVINEENGLEIETFLPLGLNKVILGIENGKIMIYEFDSKSKTSRSSRKSKGGRKTHELIYFNEISNMVSGSGWQPRNRNFFKNDRNQARARRETEQVLADCLDTKIGAMALSHNHKSLLVSTFKKSGKSHLQQQVFIFTINEFGSLDFYTSQNLSKVANASGTADTAYGFVTMKHKIFDRNLVLMAQMEHGSNCDVYFIDSKRKFKKLFSFEINSLGKTVISATFQDRHYTLNSKGKLQVFPVNFDRYEPPLYSTMDRSIQESGAEFSIWSSWRTQGSLQNTLNQNRQQPPKTPWKAFHERKALKKQAAYQLGATNSLEDDSPHQQYQQHEFELVESQILKESHRASSAANTNHHHPKMSQGSNSTDRSTAKGYCDTEVSSRGMGKAEDQVGGNPEKKHPFQFGGSLPRSQDLRGCVTTRYVNNPKNRLDGIKGSLGTDRRHPESDKKLSEDSKFWGKENDSRGSRFSKKTAPSSLSPFNIVNNPQKHRNSARPQNGNPTFAGFENNGGVEIAPGRVSAGKITFGNRSQYNRSETNTVITESFTGGLQSNVDFVDNRFAAGGVMAVKDSALELDIQFDWKCKQYPTNVELGKISFLNQSPALNPELITIPVISP